ncbi:MAG: cheC [Peptococcaceae bacterium]|jgi:chemotaxis protein CheC|nr:cheC [Peptococcaceae bacterium]
MKDFSELNAIQLDALKEISNIGAGNAATSLSLMLGRKIDMSVPKANIAPFNQIMNYLGGAESEVAGGYMRVDGESPMGILFLIPKDQVYFFIDLIFGQPLGTTQDLNEMHFSALKEIVNILAGSYLNALSAFTQQVYSPSVPALAIDMAGAILGEVLQQIGEFSDYALVIENVFIEQERHISGHFFLLPEPKTLELLLRTLGVL